MTSLSAVRRDSRHPAARANVRRKSAEASQRRNLSREATGLARAYLEAATKETGRSEGRMMPNELVNPATANEVLQWENDLDAFVGRQTSIVTVNGDCSPGVIVEVEKPTHDRVFDDWCTFFQASRFNVRIADTAITRWVCGRDLIGLEYAPGQSRKPTPRGE